jgi:CHAD domain-containing protein
LLSARLADVRQWEERLRKAPDEVAIHQMRVSARRLRAALELFDEGDLPLERQVKRLQDALGEVRDLHVQLQWFRDRRHRRMPIILQRLERELGRAEKELGTRFHIWEEIAAKIEQRLPDVGGKGRLGGHRVRRRVGRRMKQLARRIDDADRSLTVRTAHRARITVKKVRYLAELFEPARPKVVAELLDELSALQEALGELHDADVRVTRLSRGHLPKHANELLAHAEAEREHRAEEAGQKLARWRKKRLADRLARRL